MPVGGIEVLDGFEGQVGGFDVAAQLGEFGGSPEFIGIAGEAPAEVGADRLIFDVVVVAAAKIVDEVCDDVGRAGLLCEGEVLRREHVPVESEAEFHHRRLGSGGCGRPTS